VEQCVKDIVYGVAVDGAEGRRSTFSRLFGGSGDGGAKSTTTTVWHGAGSSTRRHEPFEYLFQRHATLLPVMHRLKFINAAAQWFLCVSGLPKPTRPPSLNRSGSDGDV
jgi:hypothetical protein